MIEFSLDARSGVSPYLQVVQQVRQALRLGLLREGDQLPTVKDVVASLAINPNTVLKAYRELERDGLVAARPGVGTFVTRTLTDASLAAHEPLRRDLDRWLDQGARGRARRREHRGAVPRAPFAAARAGHSVTAALVSARGLGKRYRRRWALSDCTLEIPAGQVTGLVGPNGAGKTTLLNLAAGLLRPDQRARSRSAAAARPPTSPSWPRSGSSPRTPRPTRGCSVRDHLRLGAHLNPRLGRRRWPGRRVERLGLDPGQKAGRLSGGQRAQLALTLGLAKRPELLILDEPVASLDPLARREFLQVLMEAVAEQELSVRAVLARGRPTSSGSATTSWCSSTPEVRVAGRRRDRCSTATTGSPGRAATRPRCRPTSRSCRPAHRPCSRPSSCAPTARSSTRPGRSRALGLEDLVLAYMERPADGRPAPALEVLR